MFVIEIVRNAKYSLVTEGGRAKLMLCEKGLEDVVEFFTAGCSEDTNDVLIASGRNYKQCTGSACEALQYSAELVGNLPHIFSCDCLDIDLGNVLVQLFHSFCVQCCQMFDDEC